MKDCKNISGEDVSFTSRISQSITNSSQAFKPALASRSGLYRSLHNKISQNSLLFLSFSVHADIISCGLTLCALFSFVFYYVRSSPKPISLFEKEAKRLVFEHFVFILLLFICIFYSWNLIYRVLMFCNWYDCLSFVVIFFFFAF